MGQAPTWAVGPSALASSDSCWSFSSFLYFCPWLKHHATLCKIWHLKQLPSRTDDETQKWGTVYSLRGECWSMRNRRQREPDWEIPPAMNYLKAWGLLAAWPEKSNTQDTLAKPLMSSFWLILKQNQHLMSPSVWLPISPSFPAFYSPLPWFHVSNKAPIF